MGSVAVVVRVVAAIARSSTIVVAVVQAVAVPAVVIVDASVTVVLVVAVVAVCAQQLVIRHTTQCVVAVNTHAGDDFNQRTHADDELKPKGACRVSS